MTVAEVENRVQQWFACPQVRLLNQTQDSIGIFFKLLDQAGQGGNLSTDALIAVHAREHSAVIYSNDRDFDRFPGVKWINPLI